MKSQFQTLSFLSHYSPKSDLDREFIVSFLEKRFRITPKTLIFAPESTKTTLDTQSFIQWFESGQSAGKVAKMGIVVIMVGDCTITEAKIIGKLTEKGIETCAVSVGHSEISEASDDEIRKFQLELLKAHLQFSPDTLTLTPKYVPQNGEKVVFYNSDRSMRGLGIIRNIDPDSQDVEFFCYFIYPGPNTQRKVGYNMHECGIANLIEHTFEPMLDDEKRCTEGNGIACYRRLKRELEAEGKIWKDKLRRVEPAQPCVEKGQTYYYISDKMEVVQEMEKGTPTSKFRYYAGNYFRTREAALKMLGKWNDCICDYLASPSWPEIAD